MAFFGAVISLVIGIIIAAVGFSVERKCRIDPISVTFPELPKADGFWARESNLQKLEKFGVGCEGPEDVAFDKQGRAYTGCGDGWIKRINEDGAIENHTYVGGRPLGIFIAGDPEEIYVADAFQGLLKITHDGELHVLSTEADGVKINLADGLAVTSEGLVYFTDASSKFQLPEFLFDFLDGGGNGRLLVYDPSTKSTSVVKSGLGFANGVALSGNEDFLVFAESSRARLSRLWLKGEKKGTSEVFVDNLISFPDNVRYSEGNFYVGANGVGSIAAFFRSSFVRTCYRDGLESVISFHVILVTEILCVSLLHSGTASHYLVPRAKLTAEVLRLIPPELFVTSQSCCADKQCLLGLGSKLMASQCSDMHYCLTVERLY